MPSTNVCNELCVNITAKIYSEKILTGVCNPVYFDLMHIITPPLTAVDLTAPITRGMPKVLHTTTGMTSLCSPHGSSQKKILLFHIQ